MLGVPAVAQQTSTFTGRVECDPNGVVSLVTISGGKMLMTCDPNSCDQQGFIDAFNSFQDGAQVSVQGFTGPCQGRTVLHVVCP